jgi:putative transposase
MSQSVVKILVHVVFSTKDRVDLIRPDLEAELYKYFHGVLRNLGAKLIIANGMPNHVHLLISLGKANIPDLIGAIKRSTSAWMKRKGCTKFYWQRGYGAFSIGQSQIRDVRRYISDQKVHHGNMGFQDEFRALCSKYDVVLDERFCWD